MKSNDKSLPKAYLGNPRAAGSILIKDRIANSRLDYFLNATVLNVPLRLREMASSEKQMIPLEDIPVTNEDIPDIQQASTKDLVDAKLPSRPRRKVVIIAGVVAVIIVVAVAASLIGKYVPDYLSEANSKCK